MNTLQTFEEKQVEKEENLYFVVENFLKKINFRKISNSRKRLR